MHISFVKCCAPTPLPEGIGILAGGGRGTIIEENFVQNSLYGFSVSDGVTSDIVLRHNQFASVQSGIFISAFLGIGSLRQFVALHNRIDFVGTGPQMAILIAGADPGNAFGAVILRHNLVSRKNGSTPDSGDVGIFLNCKNCIVERNFIDVSLADNSVRYLNCTNIKSYGNRKKDHALLPGYDASSGKHVEEWELETENMLML
jgi:hypothetical protein